jgi:hypothetical protein
MWKTWLVSSEKDLQIGGSPHLKIYRWVTHGNSN